MKLLDKSQFLIELLCLIIILTLCLATYFYGKNLSCDKCSITFKQIREYGRDLIPNRIFNVSINDLYLKLLQNECLIEWDNDRGFIDKSNKIEVFSLLK